METVYGIATILATVIAWITLRKTFHSKPKEEIEHLVVQFRSTQRLSRETREIVIQCATQFDCWNENLMPGVTYSTYVDVMYKTYQENLSDELLEKLLNEQPNKSISKSMIRSLESQFDALSAIKSQMQLALSKKG
jgi:hypothetical protein